MIEGRTSAKCDPWLWPQVRAAAGTLAMIAKVQEELLGGELTSLSVGSMGQQKTDVNPLLPYYDKLQRTLLLQLESLGLNYKTTPSKVTESTKKGVDDDDPMVELYKQAKM